MKQPQKTTASSSSAIAAKVAIVGASAFLALLIALHFIKPELSPSWHMISEYAIGNSGWLMQAAFFCVALGCIGTALAIRSQVSTKAGKIGWILLLLASVGMIIAGINVTDPIGTKASEMSSHGNLHGLGFMIGVPSLTLGLTLLTVSLRKNALWASVRKSLGWLVGVAWASLVVMGFAFAVLLPAHDGIFGPAVIIGWPNRLFMIAAAVWIIVAGCHMLQLRKQRG